MAKEYVETIRSVYEQYREGDFRVSADLLDPHVTLVLGKGGQWGLDVPDHGRYVGREGVAEYTRGLLKPWTAFSMQAEEIVAVGDSVLVSVHQRGVGRLSGVPTELRYLTLWSFRGQKVIRIESFRERAEALEAAGLSE